MVIVAVLQASLRLPSGLPQGDIILPPGEQGDEEGAGSSSEDTSDAFYQALHREFETQEQIKFGLQNAGACSAVLIARSCDGSVSPGAEHVPGADADVHSTGLGARAAL